MRKYITKQCPVCNKTFQRRQDPKTLNQRTCSKTCAGILARVSRPAIYDPASNTYRIPLTKGHFAEVDACDADLAGNCWGLMIAHGLCYAARGGYDNGVNYTILMHRVILERVLGRPLLKGEVVDHVDGNGLRNTRENLRIATVAQNTANTKLSVRNTSGKRGVSAVKRAHGKVKWRAEIQFNGQGLHLGIYDTVDEAYEVYLQASRKYHGEFSNVVTAKDHDNV